MEKLEIKSGENIVTVSSNLSGTGTTESPIGYTGDFQHSDKRHLIWESTGNDYNTNITLSEPVTHFDKIMVYGSGVEAADTMHVSKNVYKTQDKLMGCDTWCYSPWTTAFQANYILAANLKISGNSGHIGGSMYWGIGSKNATWAAGKWTGTEAPKMLMPWKIFGIDRKPTYNFFPLTSEGGSISSNLDVGYSGDIATLTVTPESEVWRQSALNITGAELTGNDFMFANSNVSAQAEFEHSKDLTLVNGDHGVLSADKMSGFSGDVVTVDATTDEGWYLSAIALTGAEATGFKFMFTGSDVTAQGEYTDAGFPITYLADEHVQCTGDTTIYIPGGTGIALQTGYDTYYRISGYEVTNGTVENGVLYPTGPCTVRAIATLNTFTASGGFEQGSNVTCTSNHDATYANVPSKYAIHNAHTGEVPASWYSTSNRWNPSNASAYKIQIKTNMAFTGNGVHSYNSSWPNNGATANLVAGSTQLNQTTKASFNNTWTYSTTQTSNIQDNVYLSAKLYAEGIKVGWGSYYSVTATYDANSNNSTWSATGYAP